MGQNKIGTRSDLSALKTSKRVFSSAHKWREVFEFAFP
jgi:hypothetical protein